MTTSNNIHTAETSQYVIPERRIKPLGAAALIGEAQSTHLTNEFEPKTPGQLLDHVIEESPMHGFDIDKLEYKDQPAFAHCIHGIINKHFSNQFRYETDIEKEHAIAPPLPFHWVKSRLDIYYSEIHKGDGDKVHAAKIVDSRRKFLPEALAMADALPEIEAAREIQALLKSAGKDMAADAVSDLLVVYGITIYFIKEKQAKIRKERQEKAERAARNLGRMLQ